MKTLLDFHSTDALPGSEEKLQVLAERIRRGLPLWHPSDRKAYESLAIDPEDDLW